MNDNVFCRPDLSDRPASFTLERLMNGSPAALYRAWTEEFDTWFATPGTLLMRPEVNAAYFFEVRFVPDGEVDEVRHPHYGRFLRLEQDRHVEMTWLTGTPGTNGVETVITVKLIPEGDGTRLEMTQAGFGDQEAMEGHRENWPEALQALEDSTAGS